MAVSVLNNWTANVDGIPNGVMTIGAGTQRLAVLAYTAEFTSELSPSGISIGAQNPTGQHLQFWDNGTSDQHVYFWWWNQATIDLFNDNDIDGNFGVNVPTKHNWSFAVYEGVNQSSPVTAAGGNTSTDSLAVSSTSSADDYDVVAVSRSSANRDITSWDTLTEQWNDADDGYWTGLAHGTGGDATITIVGDGVPGDITHAHLIINAASATGIAPQAMYHYRNHGKI